MTALQDRPATDVVASDGALYARLDDPLAAALRADAAAGDAWAARCLEAPDAARWQALNDWADGVAYRETAARVVAALMRAHGPPDAPRRWPQREGVVTGATLFLDEVRADLPSLAGWREGLAGDAAGWAGLATPPMLEAVLAAALREIARAPLHPRMAQRLLVIAWEGMAADQRRAFLARVDPQGRLRGRG